MVVNFCNKLMDSINFNKIIKDEDMTKLFPTMNDRTCRTPKVAFKYTKTTKSKINNYRQTIQEGTTPTLYDCEKYDDDYKIDEHIITGNLDIIQNIELRSLMKKALIIERPHLQINT